MERRGNESRREGAEGARGGGINAWRRKGGAGETGDRDDTRMRKNRNVLTFGEFTFYERDRH